MKRKFIKYILDLFGLEEYIDGMAYEIKCNQEYIKFLESANNDFKKIVKNLRSQLIDEKSKNLDDTKALINSQNTGQIQALEKELNALIHTNKKLMMNRGQFCSDQWISCNHVLPSISVPELLVTDGETSSVASFDIHTKSFLRCFGSQTMRVPMPIAWQLIPEAPGKDSNAIYHPPQVDRRRGLELTYIRD